MITIGIDPGQKGALAFITKLNYSAIPMPELSALVAKLEWLTNGMHDQAHIFIEKAQSFPGQGITSAFNYGVHFGELLGVVQALDIPHTLVMPRTWTKVMHLGTKDSDDPKERSLEACRRLFPKQNLLASPRCKKAHDGMVDALLIAEYGRRQLTGALK